MSNAPLRSVLRTGCSATCRAVSQSRRPQIRCFSVSQRHQASSEIITFPKTSSAELDAVLDRMQKTIMLPAHLRTEERNRVLRPRYKEKLDAKPVVIELDGEIIKMKTLDWTKGDIPNTRDTFFEALSRFQTKEDWDMLPKLMEALYSNANRRFRPVDHLKLIRRAAYRGYFHKITECLKVPKVTGLALNTSEIVAEVFAFITIKHIKPTVNEKGSRQGLREIESMFEMMETDGHKPRPITRRGASKDLVKLRFPLTKDPQLLGTALLFAAGAAHKDKKVEDVIKVTNYAKLIVGQWPAGKGLLSLHPPDSYSDHSLGHWYLTENNKFLLTASPILKGMELAMDVVKPKLAAELKLRRDPLAAEVEAAIRSPEVAERLGRGKYVHNLLYNPAQAKADLAQRREENTDLKRVARDAEATDLGAGATVEATAETGTETSEQSPVSVDELATPVEQAAESAEVGADTSSKENEVPKAP